MPNPFSALKLSSVVLLAGLVLWALGWSYHPVLPGPEVMSSELDQDPVQVATELKPFEVSRQGHSYQLEPLFDYELWGLVVSQHDSNGFLDYVHEVTNDHINTKDVCVIWGANVRDRNFQELQYSSGNWTCYVQAPTMEIWKRFKPQQLSNNHLIPADDQVGRAIARASIGDQVRLKGSLVNYRIDRKGFRGTSTTRDDIGGTACEVVYVTEFETLRRHATGAMKLARAGRTIATGGAIAWLFSFFVLPFLQRRET